MNNANNKANLSLNLGVRFLFFSALLFSCNTNPEETEPRPQLVTIDYLLELKPPLSIAKYELPEDNPLTVEGVELGRHLFYEKILSKDSSLSCGSCHIQKHGFSDPAKLSLGIDGKKGDRNSMSLSNLIFQKEFFWDGRASSLEIQALDPIKNPLEMNLSIAEAVNRLNKSEKYPPLFEKAFGTREITSTLLARAIAQFERTLVSQDSKYDRAKRKEYTPTALEKLGEDLFYNHPFPPEIRGGNCGDCHSGFFQSQFLYHRNGIDSSFTFDVGRFDVTGIPDDRGKFKTPTLRNIELTAPYMHDGRFATLEEVLDHYNEHVNINRKDIDLLMQDTNNDPSKSFLALTEEEKKAIIAFLKTLTDETFLNNKSFSDPNTN